MSDSPEVGKWAVCRDRSSVEVREIVKVTGKTFRAAGKYYTRQFGHNAALFVGGEHECRQLAERIQSSLTTLNADRYEAGRKHELRVERFLADAKAARQT